jgi:hypothetical protein
MNQAINIFQQKTRQPLQAAAGLKEFQRELQSYNINLFI